MPDKTQRFVNAGINTDPLNWEEFDLDPQDTPSPPSKLKKRENVKHIHISDSSTLRTSYNFGETLGQGSFGKVISVSDKSNGSNWAMKIIAKSESKMLASINREILILKLVAHPNIIYLHKVFESNQKIYLIMEKCIGELRQKFLKKKPFSEADTKNVMLQLSSAVEYLHKNAPEIIIKGNYSQQCDIWAMGVIMYLLLVGDFPFYSSGESELTKLICHAEPKYASVSASAEALHLLKKMLEKDPVLRISAGELRQHPWLQGKPINDKSTAANVFDMMKAWKKDMMAPRGSECDWVTADSTPTDAARSASERAILAGRAGRQSLTLPVHNIEFNRGRNSAAAPAPAPAAVAAPAPARSSHPSRGAAAYPSRGAAAYPAKGAAAYPSKGAAAGPPSPAAAAAVGGRATPRQNQQQQAGTTRKK